MEGSAFLSDRIIKFYSSCEGLKVLVRNFSIIALMMLEGERIINPFFIFPVLNLIV